MPPDQPQGTPTQTGQGDDAPKYVTEEQLNRAISARISDFAKKFEKTITENLGTTLTAKLDELKASLTPADPAPDTKGKGKELDIEGHPVFKGMQRQLEELKQQNEQAKSAAAAAKAKERDQALRTKLSDAIAKGGVDARYARHVVGLLVDAEKRVRFADDDSDDIVFRDDASGDVDLATGLKGWLKTDDAKIYLPPRGSTGSGDQRGGKTPGGPQPKQSAGAALLAMAAPFMGGGSQAED